MSINKAHHSGSGVVLFFGERLLIFYNGCDMKFTFDQTPQLNCSAKGSVYLTTHRTICITKNSSIQSLSMPLLNMKQVEVKQPVFGANRIEGRVVAEEAGGFSGMAQFSLTFNKGGAIEFAQCLLEAGKRANANRHGFQAPPPYSTMDAAQLYCPPPAQYAADGSAYTFVPTHEAFARPEDNSIYMYPAPPPYPGAAVPPPYPQQQQQQQQQQQYMPNVQTAYYSAAAPYTAHASMPSGNGSGVQPSAPPSYEDSVNPNNNGKQHSA